MFFPEMKGIKICIQSLEIKLVASADATAASAPQYTLKLFP